MISKRELEVLKLLAQGKLGKQVAEVLCISEKTVINQRCAVHEKLGIHSVVELAHYALYKGLVPLEYFDGNPQTWRLSCRELQTLHLIAYGKTRKEVAAELGISVASVDIDLGRIYDKIELKKKNDNLLVLLVHIAVTHNLIDLESIEKAREERQARNGKANKKVKTVRRVRTWIASNKPAKPTKRRTASFEDWNAFS